MHENLVLLVHQNFKDLDFVLGLSNPTKASGGLSST